MGEVPLRRTNSSKFRCVNVLHDLSLFAEGLKEGDLLGPGSHGGALDSFVGVLTGHTTVGKLEKDRLTAVEAEGEFHVPLHVIGVDSQISDKACQKNQHVIEQGAGIGKDNAFCATVADITLMPEGDILHGGLGIAPKNTRKAAKALAGDRVAFVRHGRASLLAFGESLLNFQDLGALEVTELGRPAIDGATDQGDRCHEFGVTVTLNDLRGDIRRLKAKLFADELLDLGIEVRIGADSSAQHAVSDPLAGLLEAFDRADKLIVHNPEFEAEGDWLRMDAVAATDHRGEFVLFGPGGYRHEKFLQILEQDVGRLDHLDGQSGIEQIGGGESPVNPAGWLTDMGGDLLEEGYHVMIRTLFDLTHLLNAEGSLLTDRFGILLGEDPELGHPFTGQRLDFEPDF